MKISWSHNLENSSISWLVRQRKLCGCPFSRWKNSRGVNGIFVRIFRNYGKKERKDMPDGYFTMKPDLHEWHI